MEFLSDIFIQYWKEVVVAVMLTATLPFIRIYVRRQRAKMLKFFRGQKQLEQSLLEEEKKRKEAEELLAQERKAREESERKLQAETDAKPLYEQGEKYYADKNYNDALYYYRRAAELGHAPAQYSLGYMYENGKGVEYDYEEAVKWYRKTAEQEYAPAQYNLGVMYSCGMGVEEDNAEAVKWYRKAAQQGYTDAQEVLKRRGETW